MFKYFISRRKAINIMLDVFLLRGDNMSRQMRYIYLWTSVSLRTRDLDILFYIFIRLILIWHIRFTWESACCALFCLFLLKMHGHACWYGIFYTLSKIITFSCTFPKKGCQRIGWRTDKINRYHHNPFQKIFVTITTLYVRKHISKYIYFFKKQFLYNAM